MLRGGGDEEEEGDLGRVRERESEDGGSAGNERDVSDGVGGGEGGGDDDWEGGGVDLRGEGYVQQAAQGPVSMRPSSSCSSSISISISGRSGVQEGGRTGGRRRPSTTQQQQQQQQHGPMDTLSTLSAGPLPPSPSSSKPVAPYLDTPPPHSAVSQEQQQQQQQQERPPSSSAPHHLNQPGHIGLVAGRWGGGRRCVCGGGLVWV